MARNIYGASGAAQVVSPSGAPTMAAATVKTARTGGTTVTDILNMSGASLGGVVTPDARGQVIFQGPDSSTATYWLDFGDGGPRWAVSPVDLTAMMTTAMINRDAANNTTPSGYTTKAHLPYNTGTPGQALTTALDPLVIPRFASSGARDTAFPSPADGDRVYRTDLHANQTYRAFTTARWVTDPGIIAENTLSADAGSVTFSSIPQEWKNLVIKFRARGVTSPTTDTIAHRMSIRLNGDTATNYSAAGAVRGVKFASGAISLYDVDRAGGSGSVTATTAANIGGTAATNGPWAGLNNHIAPNGTVCQIGVMPGSSAPAGVFGGGEITIEDYANAANRKAIAGRTGFGDASGNAGTGYHYHADIQGGWSSNAAISTVALLPVVGGNFAAGSYFAIYGW
jgi:hypothetical protein